MENGEVGAMTWDKMTPVVLFQYLDSTGHIEKSPWHNQVQYTESIGQRGTSSVASLQTSFGFRLSRIHFSPTDVC